MQSVHDHFSDFLGIDLLFLTVKDLRFDLIDHLPDLGHGNRPLMAGTENASLDLGPVVGLPVVVLLDDDHGNGLYLFIGGKASGTDVADSSSADGIILFHRS